MTSPHGTQAIDRAAWLLSQVVHRGEPVAFADLAAASGLAKSTTSRLLMALERHQLLRRDGSGRFRPGELFIRYAWQGTGSADLVALAQPYLERLGQQTGETVNLGIAVHPVARAAEADAVNHGGRAGGGRGASGGRAGGGRAGGGRGASGGGHPVRQRPGQGGSGTVVEQIAQVDSRYMIGGTNWVGLTVPLHCSALGKVLLAFGAAELPQGRLPRRTTRTITTRATLSAELAIVRRRGYAVTDAELEPGLVAVAAPVFADGPVPVAAISVSGPSARLAPEQIPAVAGMCVAAARGLSDVLAPPAAVLGPQAPGPRTASSPTASSPTEGAA